MATTKTTLRFGGQILGGSRKTKKFKVKNAFTLIELLIVMAIIGILTGVLVPMVERSLAQNRLSDDVEIFKAKVEQTRLLAGSTRGIDESTSTSSISPDEVGYYGVYIPSDTMLNNSQNNPSRLNYYAIVRLSRDGSGFGTVCPPATAIADAGKNTVTSPCLVERVNLHGNNAYVGASSTERIIAFTAPTGLSAEIVCDSNCSVNAGASMFNSGSAYFTWQYQQGKQAAVAIKPLTTTVSATYQ